MFTSLILRLGPILASFGRWMALPALVVAALAIAEPAQGGLIVSVQVCGAGMSATQRQGGSSRVERAGAAENDLLDFSRGASSPSSGSSSNTTSSMAGSTAVLPQTCGLPSPGLIAGLWEERALRLPPSPFFDHLRPPQA